MGNLTIALVFVLSLNVLVYLADVAVTDINPDGTNFYTAKGSMIEGFAKNSDLSDPQLDKEVITNTLPTSGSSVETDSGFEFSDILVAIRSWVSQAPGIKYIYGIIMAPYNLLQAMNIPGAVRFAVGAFWYGITLFLVVSFFFGRGD